MKQTTKNCIRFLAALIAAFILLDCALAFFYGRYILRSGDFWLNDYELTRRDHPEKVWDKVIFGSSELVAGFRDEESESGYINLGMDYGTIRDLLTMLKKKTITVGSELVLAVDSLCFYDGMDTNPVYPWHRQLYEPYAYFMRDRLNTSLMNAVKRLSGEEAARGLHREQTKAYYEGCLTGEELDAKVEKFDAMFYSKPFADYQKNLDALDALADWCAVHGIRLRLLWLPRNPAAEIPARAQEVMEEANARCERHGVEVHDLTHALPTECFYDLGHVNREYGSWLFMEVVDPWLCL